ncbi:MAG TPA: SCO family protein, partial [Acetobacteraceae bacterium]|nr:SCO family protein [Acetobacteraceae bacterium]
MMRVLLLLLFLLAPMPLCAAPDTSGLRFEGRLGAQLPMDAPLRDETGRPVTLGAVAGGLPLVLALGYFHCPGLCGLVREDALGALDRSGLRPGTDYRLLILSIDPDETPGDAANAKEGALARYADPGANWRFLTAAAPSVQAITAAAGFRYRFDPALKQFLHPAGLVIASPAGVISSYLPGLGHSPGELRAAVLRAGQGGLASALSPVLLLCFHFDPQTGRYNLAVSRALSVMAALTALTLGGYL